ncbi:hypothetical protein S40293_06504 [Stachybotrys chartarum IBT 40293]|nr:hypothetical protein S40293_06504 [Stachybotrys chartarum IBT 40293]
MVIAGQPTFLVDEPELAGFFDPKGELLKVGVFMTRKKFANYLLAYLGTHYYCKAPLDYLTLPSAKPVFKNKLGFKSAEAHYIVPDKRRLSSIAPVIHYINNHHILAAFGGAGGSRIVSAVAQTLRHYLDYGLTMGDAITTAVSMTS